MGFFSKMNIPKPPKLDEVGEELESVEINSSVAMERRRREEEQRRLLTPMDLLHMAASDGQRQQQQQQQQQGSPQPIHPMFNNQQQQQQQQQQGPPVPPPGMRHQHPQHNNNEGGMPPPRGPPPPPMGNHMHAFPPLGSSPSPPPNGMHHPPPPLFGGHGQMMMGQMQPPLGPPPPGFDHSRGPPHHGGGGGGRGPPPPFGGPGAGGRGSGRGGRGGYHHPEDGYNNNNNKERRIRSGPLRDGRPRFQGELMTGEEIEQILRIQWKATHPNFDKAYASDYYHQAFLAKNNPQRLREPFCPEELRELPSHVKEKRGEVTFVPGLEGLGKVPFANVQTPKQLLQIPTGPEEDDDDENDDENEPKVRLANEPLLAARIMIEDAMHLLLDVDDIDRLLSKNEFSADDALNNNEKENEDSEELKTVKQKTKESLSERKRFLLEGLVSTLRLPESPVLNGDESDAVFQRITSLPKGRVMLSSVLRALDPSSAAAKHLVWAVFRNVGKIAKSAEKSAAKSAKGNRAAAAAAAAFSQQGVITDVDKLIRSAAHVSSMLPKEATESALGAIIVGISYADTQGLILNCLTNKRSPRESIQESLAIVVERGKVVKCNESESWKTALGFAFDFFNRQAQALVSNERNKSDPDACLSRSLMRALLPQLDDKGKQRIAELNACAF